jgi:sugar lactone lactonase YvrE
VAVTDIAAPHRLLVMQRDGEVLFAAGSQESSATTAPVTFDYPNNVSFLDDGVWVSDSNNRRVLEFGRDGTLESELPIEGVARGVALLERGGERYLAVVDTLGGVLVLLDPQGREVERYGHPGSTAGRFAYPNDVVYDPATAQVFIADTGNARVQVWAVRWPGDEPPAVPAAGFELTPMRLFGIGLLGTGLLLALLAAVLRRKKAGKLL